MSILNNYNESNMNIMKISYEKKKINYFFLNYKFIIFVALDNVFYLKNKILNYNLSSMILKKKYVQSLFELPNFYFLNNINILCIFIKDEYIFVDFIKFLENKLFFYSYMNCISCLTDNNNVILEYKKYNKNYIYIQFLLKKIKIKIILLFLFLLISLIKYIK